MVRRRRDRGLLFSSPPRPQQSQTEGADGVKRRAFTAAPTARSDLSTRTGKSNSAQSQEPWKHQCRRNTLFTKSSPRRVRGAAVLIVVFVSGGNAQLRTTVPLTGRHRGDQNPPPHTPKPPPPHSPLSFWAAFALIPAVVLYRTQIVLKRHFFFSGLA